MMNKCKNCKYFGPEITEELDNGYEVGTGYHACELIKHGNKFPEYAEAHPTDKAFVEDGSGYFAALRVREDFGCIEFKPKGSDARKEPQREG